MFALKLLAGLLFAASASAALNCDDGRTCVYMTDCGGELKEGCPLAYSYKLEGDILSMELAGYQEVVKERYLAIGFNEQTTMANARVTECSAIGDEAIPSIKLSWNKDPGTAYVRIDDEPTFRDQIISDAVVRYENGLLFCSWKQNVGPFENPKVFQHKTGVKYQQLAAYGATTTDPSPKLMKHDKAEHTVFDYLEKITSLNCVDGRSCVYMDECNGVLTEGCPLAYSYKLDGEILSMELAGYQPTATNRYLAIGFNENEGMPSARVTECSAIGDETMPTVKLSYNKDEGTANVRIDNESTFRDQIISNAVVKYENGLIYCSWTQKVGAFNNPQVLQVKPGTKYHHIVAHGETQTNPDKLGYHQKTGRQSTLYTTFDGSEGLNCDNGRTCIYMKPCNGTLDTNCPLAYSFKLDGDILSMELVGYQKEGINRYLAIGFGEKDGMADSRVTECSAIGDEKYPTVKLSYNTKDPETSVNVRIDNEPEFRDSIISDAKSKYEDGMIYCSWKQNVSTDNDQVFQRKEGVKYHHIIAYGPTAVDETYAGLDQHEDTDQPLYTDFEGDKGGEVIIGDGPNCNDGRTCEYMASCKGVFSTTCPLAYSFKLDGDILSMELMGYQSSGTGRYLAIGFGEKSGMVDSYVTECSAIGDEATPSVKLSFNDPDLFANVRIENEPKFRDSIISEAVATYQDGKLYCSWKQNVSSGNDKVFNRKEGVSYQQIIAYGSTTNTSLAGHDDKGLTLYTDFKVPDDDGGDTSKGGLNCDDGRECVYMKECKGVFGTSCPLAYSFKLEGDLLSLELAGYSSGVGRYLAIGFGEKSGMVDSYVTECSAIGDEATPSVKLSYNDPGPYANVRIDNEPDFRASIISDAKPKYEDGMIHCSWKQNVSSGNPKVFNRKAGVMYYNIVAYGPTTKTGLDVHNGKENTIQTDFANSSQATGDTTNQKLIKAHGSLMMIGWLIAVPIAAIFARFLRSHWPTKKPFGLAVWFHVHRTCNILACLIFIAGFVCIFIETSWQWRGVGSSSYYWVATHSTVGIIACVLAWLQPFISLLRCDPQNPRRPVFNWVHRMIGMTAFILAVTATSIASNNFTIWKTDDHLLFLILSFVPLGSVIVLLVIMTILDAKIRVHDANIVKIHAIRFTLVCIAIAVAAGAAIALVVLLILA